MSNAQVDKNLQEEVRQILIAMESLKKEIISNVAEENYNLTNSIISSFQMLENNILVRYRFVPSQDDIPEPSQQEARIEEKSANVVPSTTVPVQQPTPVQQPIPAPVPQLQPTPQAQPSQDVVIDNPTPDVTSKIPANMSNRLAQLQWFKTKGANYVLRSLTMVDPDIKEFWLSLVGTNKESDRFNLENYVYQVVLGRDGSSYWLRRWDRDQQEKNPSSPK